jgi:6-pyruvoyltetrahydropterin/6-carboxytetrahydropterin synthase
MVIDFGDLKQIYKDHVDAAFDHRTLLFKDDQLNRAIASALPEGDDQIVWTSFNPTAENIAALIYNIFESRLPRERGLRTTRVRLYETPTSFADVLERPFGNYTHSRNINHVPDNQLQEDEFDNSANP